MSQAQDFKVNQIQPIEVTVLATQTVSDAAALTGTSISGFMVPAGLTSTAITFQVSVDGVTYVPLRNDNNNPVTYTVNTGAAAYGFSADLARAWRFIKIVCGSAEAANRTFTIVPYKLN